MGTLFDFSTTSSLGRSDVVSMWALGSCPTLRSQSFPYSFPCQYHQYIPKHIALFILGAPYFPQWPRLITNTPSSTSPRTNRSIARQIGINYYACTHYPSHQSPFPQVTNLKLHSQTTNGCLALPRTGSRPSSASRRHFKMIQHIQNGPYGLVS